MKNLKKAKTILHFSPLVNISKKAELPQTQKEHTRVTYANLISTFNKLERDYFRLTIKSNQLVI